MLQSALHIVKVLSSLESRLEKIQLAIGRIEARLGRDAAAVGDSEFGTFSQFGEDGIIQRLVSNIEIPNRVFVEFGVEDYRESNTRFLLLKDYWSGLVLDSSEANVKAIRSSDIYWRHRLAAKAAFVTAGNINAILSENGVRGDIGILSIDVDGNDYWIWNAVEVVSPRIVIVEYNSLFGSERAVTIPYDAQFDRARAHYSKLYFGASIAAFARLAKQRNYSLVSSNRAGNNLFFVRNDVLGALTPSTAKDAWRISSFRESRNRDGVLTFLPPADALATIGDMPLIDLEADARISVSELRPSFPPSAIC